MLFQWDVMLRLHIHNIKSKLKTGGNDFIAM